MKMKLQTWNKRNAIGIVGILFILFIFLMFNISKTLQDYLLPVVECEKPKKGYLSQQITLEGEIVLCDTKKITAMEQYNVQEIMVNEGGKITPGDLLLKFDTSQIELDIKSKELERKKILVDIKKLKTDTEKSELALRADMEKLSLELEREQKNYDDIKALYTAGAEPLNTLEEAKYKLDSVKHDYDLKNKEIGLLKQSDYKEEIEEKNAELELLDMELQKMKTVRELNGRIESRIKGIVRSVDIHCGVNVVPGQILFTVDVDKETPIFEGWCDAAAANYIKKDTKVSISSDGPVKIEGEGVVNLKEYVAEKDRYKITCPVTAKKAGDIYDHQKVYATYLDEKSTNGLILPKTSINREMEKRFVFVLGSKEEGKGYIVKKLSVDVLDENEREAVIDSFLGTILTPETYVVTRSSKPLKDGMRVREKGGFSYETDTEN